MYFISVIGVNIFRSRKEIDLTGAGEVEKMFLERRPMKGRLNLDEGFPAVKRVTL